MAGKSSKKKSPTSSSALINNGNQTSRIKPTTPPPQSPKNPSFDHLEQSTGKPPEAMMNSTYFKVQTLDNDPRQFLNHDYEYNKEVPKCLQYYRILVHFNSETTSRPTHRKDKLIAAFMKDVFPLLRPYRMTAPPAPMQIDQKILKDFNPTSRRVKKQDLVDVILEAKPTAIIPKGTKNDALLYLYKEHVDNDLKLPGQTQFIRPPNVVQRAQVHGLLMEELRLTLQDLAPHVFIHLNPMTHTVLVNLYIKFVIDEEVEPGVLVRGFHHSLLRKAP